MSSTDGNPSNLSKKMTREECFKNNYNFSPPFDDKNTTLFNEFDVPSKKKKITYAPSEEMKIPEHFFYREVKQISRNIEDFMCLSCGTKPSSSLYSNSSVKIEIVKLTPDGGSWLIHAHRYKPSFPPKSLISTKSLFQQQWETHPSERKCLGKIYGRICFENRWSQSYGVSYSYSGYRESEQADYNTNTHRPIHEDPILEEFINEINHILATSISFDQEKTKNDKESIDKVAHQNNGALHRCYNGCLKNWYLPEHTLAAHSDDEKQMRPNSPIFSLSWGGPRRFVIKPKLNKTGYKHLDLMIHDGDLIVMGGAMQNTHTHEVPKWRKTIDPPTGNRINWTVREFLSNNP